MTEWLIAVLIGVIIGLLLGVRIARESHRTQPIKGGALAVTFHYLACAGLTALLPFVLAGTILGVALLAVVGTVLGLLALTAIALLLYEGAERIHGRPTAAA